MNGRGKLRVFRLLRSVTLAISLVWVIATPKVASAVTVYGGLTYNTSSGVGYLGGGAYALPRTAVTDAGFSVVSINKWANINIGTCVERVYGSATAPFVYANLSSDSSGNGYSEVRDTNESAVSVGISSKTFSGGQEESRAVRWNAAGSVTELGILGTALPSNFTNTSEAVALNQAGTAVGWSKDYLDWRVNYGDPHAVRWDASGTTATELPLPAGSIDDSRAVDINDSGVIVGNVRDYRSGQNYLAVRWNADGSFDELGGLGTDSSGNVTVYAEAINNAGTTVGEAAFYVNGVFKGGRVVRWNANSTTPIEYETLGPDENGYGTGNVTRINSAGHAIGLSEDCRGGACGPNILPVRWDAAGHIAPLPVLTPDDCAAIDINDADVVVGYSAGYSNPGGHTALAWKADNVTINLNKYLPANSGWYLATANGISNTGWVSGEGYYSPPGSSAPSYLRAYLMRVPELAVLPGDYNENGVVDAADYVIWKDNQNSVDSLPNDDTPGVGSDDYTRWRAHFGQSLAGGASITFLTEVPEPRGCMWTLLCALAWSTSIIRQRKWQHA